MFGLFWNTKLATFPEESPLVTLLSLTAAGKVAKRFEG